MLIKKKKYINISGFQLCGLLKLMIEQRTCLNVEESALDEPEISFRYNGGLHCVGIYNDKQEVYLDRRRYSDVQALYRRALLDLSPVCSIKSGIMLDRKYVVLLSKISNFL